MLIGVLAIQGDFAAHARALRRISANAIEVRRAVDLDAVNGLIIPGGESTTMLKFVEEERLAGPIADFARAGKAIFGTCAGAILVARRVTNPSQASLGLIDIVVERNGYGRQVNSFICEAPTSIEGGPLEAVFIRAPRITGLGPNAEIVASLNGEPILVRENNVLAATFHPELTDDTRLHRLFVEMARSKNCAQLALS